MGEVWAAAVGAAVAIGGTAYSIYSSQAAISAANSVSLPKFVPIDPKQVATDAAAADRSSYAASDADYYTNPLTAGVAKGRDYAVQDSVDSLKGNSSGKQNAALASSGFSATLGSGFDKARALGAPILSQEQRDRTYFQSVLGANPRRQIGLSGSDIAHIAIANTNSQNNFNQGLFGSRINQYNSALQQSAQNVGAGIGAIGGLVGVGTQLYQNSNSPYLNASTYQNNLPANLTLNSNDADYGNPDYIGLG